MKVLGWLMLVFGSYGLLNSGGKSGLLWVILGALLLLGPKLMSTISERREAARARERQLVREQERALATQEREALAAEQRVRHEASRARFNDELRRVAARLEQRGERRLASITPASRVYDQSKVELWSKTIVHVRGGLSDECPLTKDTMARLVQEGAKKTHSVREASKVARGSQGGVQAIAGAQRLVTEDDRKITVLVTSPGWSLNFEVHPDQVGLPAATQFVDQVKFAIKAL